MPGKALNSKDTRSSRFLPGSKEASQRKAVPCYCQRSPIYHEEFLGIMTSLATRLGLAVPRSSPIDFFSSKIDKLDNHREDVHRPDLMITGMHIKIQQSAIIPDQVP